MRLFVYRLQFIRKWLNYDHNEKCIDLHKLTERASGHYDSL